MVCHLGDSFRMVTDGRQVRPATGPLQATVVKWIALYAPLTWPADIQTLPELDQHIGGTKPADFEADVAALEALVDGFAAETRRADLPPHPIFGRMSQRAWLRWGYLHMDHHLRQFGV